MMSREVYGNQWDGSTQEQLVPFCCAKTCASAVTCPDGQMLDPDQDCEWDFEGGKENMCAFAGETKGKGGRDFDGCCTKKTCMNDPSITDLDECRTDDWFDSTCGKKTDACKTLCELEEYSQEKLQACADCAAKLNNKCFACIQCMVDHHMGDMFGPLVDNTPTVSPSAAPSAAPSATPPTAAKVDADGPKAFSS